MMRRHRLPATVALCGALAGAFGQETAKVNPFEKDEVDRALERGVSFLLKQQAPDGSIFDGGGRRRGRVSVERNTTAMTSLAIMAIASLGHEPGDTTPEGEALRKALDCILRPERQTRSGNTSGYFGQRDGSRMYGHGITTLMLAEMLGMGVDEEQDRRIRERLQPALELILRSQMLGDDPRRRKDARFRGGWRYNPDSRDADLSVTVWQVMALRSAKNAGLAIPKEAIDEAAAYIRRSYRSYRSSGGGRIHTPSPFAYQPGGRAEYSTASAGMLSLQVCGYYEDPTVAGAADWLLARRVKDARNWFFYGTYYYAQGMYQRGGRHAEEARRQVRDVLLERQEKAGENAGSWRAAHGQEQSAGRVYATSLAMLSLSVKYHYLPIYQR